MKRLLLTLFALITWVAAYPQATQVWCENFDGTLSTTSSGTPGFNLDVNYTVSAPNSIRGEVGNLTTSTLTSPQFSTLGQNFVKLDFDQICKIDFSDRATIEFSLDGGVNWTALDDDPLKLPLGPGNCYYQPTVPNSVFNANGNAFSEGSHAAEWLAGSTTAPANSWWIHEVFDISLAVANQPSVMLRFKFEDQFGGMNGRYGWLLDDICVTAAPCELVPPTVSIPYPGNPFYTGTVFTLPPWDIFVSINDLSGISAAELYWTINNGPVQQYGGMINLQDSMWAATIFSGNVGDTICYWVEATDASGCNNFTRFPSSGCINVIIVDGLTPPFCDNFDVVNPNFTPDPASVGTPWVNGTPTGATLSSAHSAPNVWGVGVINNSGNYSDNSNTILTSSPIDFSAVSVVNLEMYINRASESTWDGMRIEYSNDNGTTWNILGTFNDPNAINWYSDASIGANSLPAWEGGNNGWEYVKYKLASVAGMMGSTQVLFRFIFASDGIINDEGFHIDDFCLSVPCNDDLGVSALNSPPAGSGQAAGSSSTVSVTIENFGQATQSNVTIGYSIGGVVQTPVTFAGPLTGGLTSAFSLPAFTVPNGAYDVCIWTELPGDCIGTNDTICISFVGIPTYTPSPSYCDDFDAGNNGWSTQNGPNNPVGCNWEQGAPNFGVTNSAHSGINAWDINLTTGYPDNADNYLYSPFFDFSTIASGNLNFWINFFTENNWDGLVLEFTNDGGTTWNVIGTNPNDPCGTNWYNNPSIVGINNQPGWCGNSNGWINVAYKLCCTTGIFNSPTPIQFRFHFGSDPSVSAAYSGVSLDDFCINAVQGDDVGISAITSPIGGYPVGSSTNVIVTLENFGSSTITSCPITYTVNGGNPQTIIWTGSLPPCGTVSVTLPPFIAVQGTNLIQAYTSLASDQLATNDTSIRTIIGQPLITPDYLNWFSDNFDSGNIGWSPDIDPAANPGTIWEFGTPNFGQTTGAYTAPNCWDVNLNSAPTPNANCWVTSPFFDLTNAAGAILRFYQNRNIYLFGDSLLLEYQINGNGAWTKLVPSTQIVTNWHNNGNSWDDISAGWIQSTFKDVTGALGTPSLVQFRFRYSSQGFTNAEGVSIDNFEIFVPIPLSVQTVSVNTSVPCQFIFPGQPITFAAPIKNNGVNQVYIHNATLTIDGAIVSVDQVAYTGQPGGSLAPDSTLIHNFNNTWIASPGFHQVCVYTDSPNGTLDLYQPDDTACTTVLVFDSISAAQLPYCTSFESGNQWVTANSFTYCIENDWQMGTPAKPNLNGAHTGNVAWSTNLTGTYANKDSSGLFSALIRVQTNHCYKMSFYQQYRMEYGTDGGTLHYSDDYGVNWNRLDLVGTPNMQLFGASPNYTYVSELDPINPANKGFTGIRNDWFYTEKVFRPDVNSQIVIRWRFASDYSVVEEGWDVDDFCFEDLGVCAPIGVEEFAMDNFGMSQNYPNPAEDNTTFDIAIPTPGQVRIVLTDLLGQVVSVIADQNMDAGVHTLNVNTSTIAPGLYTYTLQFEGQQVTKRMIVTH